MKYMPKIIFIIGAAALLGTFLAPIWRITLEAPQYPQGVTMYIWINKLDGAERGTLQNINILNHYVGMKMIEPESIPELKYFPKIIIGMAVMGVLFGFINNKNCGSPGASHLFCWVCWAFTIFTFGNTTMGTTSPPTPPSKFRAWPINPHCLALKCC